MEFNEIRELIKLVEESNIGELKLELDNFKLTIRSKAYTKALLRKTRPWPNLTRTPCHLRP